MPILLALETTSAGREFFTATACRLERAIMERMMIWKESIARNARDNDPKESVVNGSAKRTGAIGKKRLRSQKGRRGASGSRKSENAKSVAWSWSATGGKRSGFASSARWSVVVASRRRNDAVRNRG